MLSRRGAATPGRLSHRLTLEKPAGEPDGGGGESIAWTEITTLLADIVPVRAEEARAGEGLATRITHRIVVRHRPDIEGGDRFRLGQRLFHVRAVHDPAEDRRFLVCLAEEVRS